MTVRAKFRVDSVTDTEIKMTAVTSQPGEEGTENFKFWQATPSGTLHMQVLNPEATKQFHQGDEFYLTFDKA